MFTQYQIVTNKLTKTLTNNERPKPERLRPITSKPTNGQDNEQTQSKRNPHNLVA